MLLPILQLLAVGAFLWSSWRIVRHFLFQTDLDNIPGPPSQSFLTGNFKRVFNPNAWSFHQEIAEKYGSVVKIKAMFGENQLFVFDPKAMHHIIVKDQYIYEETSSFIVGNRIIFGEGLLGTLGGHHRKQRKMLNPVFSIAHMREMIPVFWKVSRRLQVAFQAKLKNGPQEIDVTHWMTRTALELIGQSGLGYSFDPLAEDATAHPYSTAAKRLGKIGSPRFQRWVIDMLPWKTIHELRDIVDLIHNTSLEIFKSKKRALEEGDEVLQKQVAQGKDIMSILLRENMNASEEDRLTESELLGQMSTLTFAAMDTTSGALSKTLYLLSTHPNVQERLRQEILTACRDGEDLSYDDLVDLPYLDAVCRETLRFSRQDIILPFSSPVKGVDGREMEEVFIPNNTNVIVSILNSNRNRAIWGEDSYEWKPER
ncbi:cytochrome P450 [Crucibulum laeve]|uniref:Cytochrome P450 n=1 Tax=Crucibulum laeve TaxID=68775 RepID=A0A5C3M464_9AGAR|nr:cytochrome P450 [Crucibulum laeve]